MGSLELVYNILLNTLGYAAFPYIWSRTKDDPVFRRGRVGVYDGASPGDGRPRIWFHASSVGEVTGAVQTLRALLDRLPDARTFLTVGTPQGFRFAVSQLPAQVQVLPFPLDFPWALRRAFDYVKPDLYVGFEGEFWPNLYRFLAKGDVPALLFNGRLSRRSAKWYRLFLPLFQTVFGRFRWLAMHSEKDLRNVLSLGVSSKQAFVLGSSKYGGLCARVKPERAQHWGKLLRISESSPVIVGGSLRRNECNQLLEVFQGISSQEPSALGVFAPRHMDRVPSMVDWLESRGIPFHLFTQIEQGRQKREKQVVLVDRIGVLFELYSVGDLIFCGGTLEPIGGHNILEPAAWRKAVFYGPHLHKVLEEHNTLQSFGGSFLVKDPRDLGHQWSYWIRNLQELKTHGNRARAAVDKLGGVSEKQAELILSTLSERAPHLLERVEKVPLNVTSAQAVDQAAAAADGWAQSRHPRAGGGPGEP